MSIRQSCIHLTFRLHINSTYTKENVFFCTKFTDIVAISDYEIGTYYLPCSHEEADTGLILHALNCAKRGHRRILIRSVDSDVRG